MMKEEIAEAFKQFEIGKAHGPSEVYAEMIIASWMLELDV